MANPPLGGACPSPLNKPLTTLDHIALRLAVDIHVEAAHRTTEHPRRPCGRPRHTWMRQLEADTGLNADNLWNIASDRDAWRALRPVAGQALQWVRRRNSEGKIQASYVPVTYNTECLVSLSRHVLLFTLTVSPVYRYMLAYNDLVSVG